MDAALDAEHHARLATRIAAVSGIRVPAAKRWLLSARVAERMRAAGYADVERYVDDVVSGAHEDELGRLVESVRVGETHFFRHEKQLRAIARIALPEIIARREADAERKVRVWSAGCATGEEPYTLAMLLATLLPEDGPVSWEVLATDLSPTALAVAARGRYPASAATSVPKATAAWALVPVGDEVEISERLRARVRFDSKNLLDAAYPRGFDLVLCRNVLIYFDRATQEAVIKRLARSVVPGGWLALGYAEHIAELEDVGLVPLRTDDGLLYRRATIADGERGARVAKVARARAAGRKSKPNLRPRTDGRSVPSPPSTTSSTALIRLEGELAGESGLSRIRTAASALVSDPRDVVHLDLGGLTYADDEVARVLARAAATIVAGGRRLVVHVQGAGGERFLRRHGIVPPAELQRGGEER